MVMSTSRIRSSASESRVEYARESNTQTHCNTLQHKSNTLLGIRQRQRMTADAQERIRLPHICHSQRVEYCPRHPRSERIRLAYSHCNTATHCNTLQHTAPHCSTLQHTATHCTTQHHTAIRRCRMPSCDETLSLLGCRGATASNQKLFYTCIYIYVPFLIHMNIYVCIENFVILYTYASVYMHLFEYR